MIGPAGLIVPIMGISAGYITSILITLSIGFVSYYTASLILVHLGKSRNMKESVLAHFNQDYRYMIAYSIINWLSFIPILFLFFDFVCL